MGEKTGNLNKSATSADCLISSLNKGPSTPTVFGFLAKFFKISSTPIDPEEFLTSKNISSLEASGRRLYASWIPCKTFWPVAASFPVRGKTTPTLICEPFSVCIIFNSLFKVSPSLCSGNSYKKFSSTDL